MPADIMTHASEDASQAEDVDFLLDVSRSLKQIIIHLDTPTIGSWWTQWWGVMAASHYHSWWKWWSDTLGVTVLRFSVLSFLCWNFLWLDGVLTLLRFLLIMRMEISQYLWEILWNYLCNLIETNCLGQDGGEAKVWKAYEGGEAWGVHTTVVHDDQGHFSNPMGRPWNL